MIVQGFKNYFKSTSVGNLSTIGVLKKSTNHHLLLPPTAISLDDTKSLSYATDDNSIDVDEHPLSAHSHNRADKHNLSSINEQKRELLQKLKEYSNLISRSYENGLEADFPHYLPECNLGLLQLQGSISKETYQQQSAMWELIVTEQNFLKQIQFIVEVYISTFENLSKEFFPKINATDIFSNLKEVYRVSLEFWKECMEPLVKEAVQSQNTLKSHLLKNGFTKIGITLEPYMLYCTEISTCRSHILSLEKGNELFYEYTKWAMEFEESNREMLCDHLAKPFQRLTKYKILLQAIHKYSSSNEKSDIQEMIEAVDLFLTKVNEKVEEKTLSSKLIYLSKQIDTYDVIEPLGDDLLPIINQYNHFDLTVPILIGRRKIIRQLTHHGEVKLREGPSKTVDIKLYLLTDILLITKSKKKTLNKMKIIKPPVMLDKSKFQKLTNNTFVCIFLNDFNCISSLYHFSSSDTKKVDEWIQKLEEVKSHYLSLKQSHIDLSIPREFQNSIPKVKVLQSSPRKTRNKSQSSNDNNDNDYAVECSFKRKSPVARKHKNKKESILQGVELSLESPPLIRKTSQPTLNIIDINIKRRLSKSNSFTERDKPVVKQVSYNSDVDDSIPVLSVATSNMSLNKFNQQNCFEERKNKFEGSYVGNSYKSKYRTEPAIKSGDKLDKTFSKSLNKLNY